MSNATDKNYKVNENEIVLYQPNDSIRLEVRLEEETVWLNRNQMSVLFGRDVKTIGKHINNALREELQGLATVAKIAIVHGASQKDLGKRWFAIMNSPGKREQSQTRLSYVERKESQRVKMQETNAKDILRHL